MNSPRGSLWRKWDLQVHTPFSKLNNQFGDPDDQSVWDNYVKSLFRKALDGEVAVIGICDYFHIDGYKKIKEEYLSDTKLTALSFTAEEIKRIKDILLVPNIEFRLKRFVGKDASRVNLHVVFSDEVDVSDIEEHFLHDLEFFSEKDPYNPDVKKKLKKDNLVTLGNKLLQDHPKFSSIGDALMIGMMNAVVDDDQISKQLSDRPDLFRGKYLIMVPADEDLSNIDWDSQDHLARKLIIQKSNIIISANSKTQDWALGLKHTAPIDYINEFSSLKPCVTTSDAHDIKSLFLIDNDKYTWIKADPTFEGLKQLLYEPDTRVKIQAIEPNSKETYQIIDKVKFLDGSGKNLFSADYIELNPDLNSIIGGRASGKSLLMYYIAKSIDAVEVNSRCKEDTIRHYDLDEQYNLDFEVVWKDGSVSKLSDLDVDNIFDGITKVTNKRILYIPQNYLSLLAESEKTKDDSELNKFILDVVKNYPAISTKYEQQKQLIAEQNSIVEETLHELMNTRSEALRIHEEIQKIGEVESIKKYIAEIQLKLKKIKEASGLSEDEIKKYRVLTDEKTKIDLELRKIEEDKKSLDRVLNLAISNLGDYIKNINEAKKSINNTELLKFVDKLFEGLEQQKNNMVSAQQQEVMTLLAKEVKEFNDRLIQINKELKPIEDRIKLQTELKELSQINEKENKKIATVESLTKQRDQKKQKYLKVKEDLITNYKELVNQYNSLCEILKEAEKQMQELEIGVEVKVNYNTFNSKCIDECFNKNEVKKLANMPDGDDRDYYYESDSIEKHLEFIIQLLNKTLSGTKPIRNHTVEEALTCLLSDHYFIKFGVKYQGDHISQMSPGKRALVILKLLIHFSDDKFPILLDQPDDDLDNRSIYKDLVDFIKQKKTTRQIILVSHNANMVIGSDSEEIIVANQKGQGDEIANKKFKFEYISGAIENTFRTDDDPMTLTSKGIREHALELLEGSQEAFVKREMKYDLHNKKVVSL